MTKITLLMKWQVLQAVIVHPDLGSSEVEVVGRLLHHLNTKTHQCNPSYATLAGATKLGRQTVMRSVAALEKAGIFAVDRTLEKGERAAPGQNLPSNGFTFNFGKLAQSKILTTPSQKKRPPQSQISTTPVKKSDHPQSKYSTTGSPNLGPKTGKEETGKIETGNRNQEDPTLPIDLPAIGDSANRKQTAQSMEDEFQAFMRQYPKPEDEDAARKAYRRVRKKASASDLLNGAMRYAAETQGRDPQYIKAPQNWLSAGSWKNQPRPPHAATQRTRDDERAKVAGFWRPR